MICFDLIWFDAQLYDKETRNDEIIKIFDEGRRLAGIQTHSPDLLESVSLWVSCRSGSLQPVNGGNW